MSRLIRQKTGGKGSSPHYWQYVMKTGKNGSLGRVIPSASAALILGGGGPGTPRAVAAEGLPEWRQRQLADGRRVDDAALFRHVRGMVQSGRLGAVVVSGAPTHE